MRNNPITTDFTKQFRQEYIAYPGSEEKLYSNFFFRQFAGGRNETAIIDISLEEKMSDENIVNYLFKKLRKKDLPDFTRLLCFMQIFQKKISSYTKKEPYSSLYYQQLLGSLGQCISLVSSFHEQIQKDLVDQLKIHTQNRLASGNAKYLNSGDIDIFLSEIEIFLNQVQKYFIHFNSLLQQESANCERISVTSRIEQYFLELVTFIERIILDTTSTSSQLVKWQIKLATRETEELYN